MNVEQNGGSNPFQAGFTLLELAIVLTIIGLVVGGVLVGKDLITAATVRGTISQIETYKRAVGNFQYRFNALPGDIPQKLASQFGFTPRGTYAGQGDGNGVIEGICGGGPNQNYAFCQAAGETGMFWVDLTTANGLNLDLIDGSFNTATPTGSLGSSVTGTLINLYLPTAKLGNGDYVYIWSGGISGSNGQSAGNGLNYYGISAVTDLHNAAGDTASNPNIPVIIAYNIDNKIDDGLPQSGMVIAGYSSWGVNWVGPNPGGGPTSGTATSCYDNRGETGTVFGQGVTVVEQYSVEINGGAGTNCALSFQF